MTISEIIISIVLMILITILTVYAAKSLLRDNVKAFISATLFLGISFSFALISKNLFQLNSFGSVANKYFFGNSILASVLLILLCLFLVICAFSILPLKLSRFNNYLNVLLVLFVFIEVKNMFDYEPKTIQLEEEIGADRILPVSDSLLPNIYYIVLDSYTSSESLKKYWKYDNSSLMNFLKDRGFFVASKSKSNYNQTHFTLASTLNLSYLHYDSFDKLTFAHYPNLFKLIKENVFVRILEKSGYEIINLSLFDLSENPKYYRFELIDEPHFFKNTVFEGIINIDVIGSILGFHFVPEINIIKVNLNLSRKLKDITEKNPSRNFFAYAHFMLPHPPYFFDAAGKIMPSTYANDDANMWKYLEQLKYTNEIIMNFVDSILTNSAVKPVIIIQGDHGFRFLKNKINQKSESHTILNAFYFPDRDYNLLYPEVSSVNTFRILSQKYNFLDIATLPDEIFFVAMGIGFK